VDAQREQENGIGSIVEGTIRVDEGGDRKLAASSGNALAHGANISDGAISNRPRTIKTQSIDQASFRAYLSAIRVCP